MQISRYILSCIFPVKKSAIPHLVFHEDFKASYKKVLKMYRKEDGYSKHHGSYACTHLQGRLFEMQFPSKEKGLLLLVCVYEL